MKKKVNYFCCSNCNEHFKNVMLEHCPRCKLILKNNRFLFFASVISLGIIISFIVMIYLGISNSEKYVLINGISAFYYAMIIIFLPLFGWLIYFILKNKNRFKRENKDFYNAQRTAKIEIKTIEIELNNKYLGLMILSFFLIIPVLMIPIIVDIQSDGAISGNVGLTLLTIIIAIIVILLPFFFIWKIQSQVKKQIKELGL